MLGVAVLCALECANVNDPGITSTQIMAVAAALAVFPATARAEPAAGADGKLRGDERAASDAQPGVHRVAIARSTPPVLAATLGYGYTEPQGSGDNAHHRFSSQFAAAASVVPWLSVGALANARYDAHTNDNGTIVDAALAARLSSSVHDSHFGVEVKGWAPGSERLSSSLDAISLDTRALFAQSFGNVTIASNVGYRLDRGSNVGNTASRLSHSDRLSLGLSEYNAALLGLGAILTSGRTSVLLELSGDVLVGPGAPNIRKSPLRASAGIRQVLSRRLSADVLADMSLSERPLVAPDAPLIPIEPRVTVLAGIRYCFSGTDKPMPAAEPATSVPPPQAPEPIVAATPAEAPLELAVVDDQGEPVQNAKVMLSRAGSEQELTREPSGKYRVERAAAGDGELVIEVAGFEPVRRPVSIKGGVPQSIEVKLTPLPPPSQLRGVVRSFGGKGVVAKIHVDPIGSDTTTDSSGAFQLDVPPGTYDVVIEAPGYEPQHRKVQVDPVGVVILNADLVKKR